MLARGPWSVTNLPDHQHNSPFLSHLLKSRTDSVLCGRGRMVSPKFCQVCYTALNYFWLHATTGIVHANGNLDRGYPNEQVF